MNDALKRNLFVEQAKKNGKPYTPIVLDIDLDYWSTQEDPTRLSMDLGIPLKFLLTFDKLQAECRNSCCKPRNAQQYNRHVGRILASLGRTQLRAEDDIFFLSLSQEQKYIKKMNKYFKTQQQISPNKRRRKKYKKNKKFVQSTLPRYVNITLTSDDSDGCIKRRIFYERLKELGDTLSPWQRNRMLTLMTKFQATKDEDDRRKITEPFFFTQEPGYFPTEEEIIEETKKLETLIRNLGQEYIQAIRVITVTRSMGDGFLPSSVFPTVEWHVLCMLERVFHDFNIKTFKVYDPTTDGECDRIPQMPCVPGNPTADKPKPTSNQPNIKEATITSVPKGTLLIETYKKPSTTINSNTNTNNRLLSVSPSTTNKPLTNQKLSSPLLQQQQQPSQQQQQPPSQQQQQPPPQQQQQQQQPPLNDKLLSNQQLPTLNRQSQQQQQVNKPILSNSLQQQQSSPVSASLTTKKSLTAPPLSLASKPITQPISTPTAKKTTNIGLKLAPIPKSHATLKPNTQTAVSALGGAVANAKLPTKSLKIKRKKMNMGTAVAQSAISTLTDEDDEVDEDE